MTVFHGSWGSRQRNPLIEKAVGYLYAWRTTRGLATKISRPVTIYGGPGSRRALTCVSNGWPHVRPGCWV